MVVLPSRSRRILYSHSILKLLLCCCTCDSVTTV
jgi:hypothetical protein